MYVPLDVNFPDNDKVVETSLAATGLYVTALCLCKRLQRDGDVSKAVLRRYCDTMTGEDDKLIRELVTVGLFEDAKDAVRIPAWLGHNQASDEYMTADKGSRMAHTRWHVGRGVTKPDCQWCQEANPQVDASPCPADAGGNASDAAPHMQEVKVEVEQEKEKEGRQAATSPPETVVVRAKRACLLRAKSMVLKRVESGEDIRDIDALAEVKAKKDLWPVIGDKLTALAAEVPDASPSGLLDALAAAGPQPQPTGGPPPPRNIYRVDDDRRAELEAEYNRGGVLRG